MDEPSHKDLFLQSLNRCTKSEDFIPAFYDRFLASSYEIRDKFRRTDFAQQNKMLLRSLRLIAGATAGDSKSLQELRERTETHNRYHLNIQPRLYDLWRSVIIKTASEFDDQWNDDVETAWNAILGHVIDHMIKYY